MNLLNLSRGAVITEVTHTFHPPKPTGEGGHTHTHTHTHTHSVLKFLLATTLLFMMTASYAQKDNWILYPTRIDFDAGPGYSPAGFSNPNLTQPYAVENSVFPNPFNRELTLAHDSALKGQGIFRLINMAGQTVYQQVLQAAPAQTLQLPQLPAGIYLYTWQSDGETAQGKLIRE